MLGTYRDRGKQEANGTQRSSLHPAMLVSYESSPPSCTDLKVIFNFESRENVTCQTMNVTVRLTS